MRSRRIEPVALGGSNLATCWLKNQVKPLVENRCCASGVKGAALLLGACGKATRDNQYDASEYPEPFSCNQSHQKAAVSMSQM